LCEETVLRNVVVEHNQVGDSVDQPSGDEGSAAIRLYENAMPCCFCT